MELSEVNGMKRSTPRIFTSLRNPKYTLVLRFIPSARVYEYFGFHNARVLCENHISYFSPIIKDLKVLTVIRAEAVGAAQSAVRGESGNRASPSSYGDYAYSLVLRLYLGLVLSFTISGFCVQND